MAGHLPQAQRIDTEGAGDCDGPGPVREVGPPVATSCASRRFGEPGGGNARPRPGAESADRTSHDPLLGHTPPSATLHESGRGYPARGRVIVGSAVSMPAAGYDARRGARRVDASPFTDRMKSGANASPEHSADSDASADVPSIAQMATRCVQKTRRDCHRSATSTSTCWDATRSPYLNRSLGASSGRSETPLTAVANRTFRSIAPQTPRSPASPVPPSTAS